MERVQFWRLLLELVQHSTAGAVEVRYWTELIVTAVDHIAVGRLVGSALFHLLVDLDGETWALDVSRCVEQPDVVLLRYQHSGRGSCCE